MSKDNAPFYIGQKVVCISPTGPLVKDVIYTAQELHFCSSCNLWHVGLAEMPAEVNSVFNCSDCLKVMAGPSQHYYKGCRASRFAPYNPYSNSVSKELADKACEPVIEIDQPVKKMKEPLLN